MEKEKLVILDGNSLMNRAFYALPEMTTSEGLPTNAIYGFTTMLLKILNDIKPEYIAATFDRKAPTFRHKDFADYKAGRKKMPPELGSQFEPVKEILRAFNIGIFEKDTYEADDIIGTISKIYEAQGYEVIIFTGDRDALQLVSENTRVMITKKGITETDLYNIDSLKEKYGLKPEGIIDLKGLMGDASDNIPGVAGVGEKTAVKLLNEYETLENVYNNLDKISGKKLKENLINHREEAYLSKRLATINREVPIEIDLDSMNIKKQNSQKIKELFLKFEFNSLVSKLANNVKESASADLAENIVFDIDNDKFRIDEIKDKGIFNFIFVMDNKDVKGMIIEDNCFVEKNNITLFKELFQSEEITKNTFNAKAVYLYALKNNIKIRKLDFDFEIASYLLNPSENQYTPSNILEKYVNIRGDGNSSDRLTGLFVNNFDKIKEKMTGDIEKLNMTELLRNIEMPLIEVLAEMEHNGFKVDKESLKQIGFTLSEEIDSLTVQIFDLAGEEFNINSPKQLGSILFEKLNLPVIKKTKTGYSTDAEVLEQLSSKHEIIEKVLNYRQLVKLKSTYIEGLMNSISSDGKIHSSFNQTVTATGRISSTEPNLQNIPIKMEQGRQIRKAFIPSTEEYVILSADYSQIELRVLAHISKDENLIDAFIHNQDIHRRTASEVFEVPIDEVTSLQRSRAKAVNFGIVYGLSDFGLAKDLKIFRNEAKKYIDNYFERYKGVKEYLNREVEEAREKGYVITMMNRIRYIPEINSRNRNVKMLGERLAMNTPIQGFAADIIKKAMIGVFNKLKTEKLKSRLILQVHDELVLEVHHDELEHVSELVREQMEGAVELRVPLTIDINVGKDWYDAK